MKPVLEKVKWGADVSFGVFEFRGQVFDCPYHFHPEIEITHVFAGTGQRLVGDSLEEFGSGDLVMHGAGLPHMYRNWDYSGAGSRYVQFLPDALGAGFFALPECRAIADLLKRAERGLRFSEAVAEEGRLRLARLPVAGSGPRRLTALIELLELLATDGQARELASVGFAGTGRSRDTARLKRVLNYIDAHWDEPIRLADAAREAGMHPHALSRFFRQKLRKTFQEYVIEVRLGRVARGLLETGRPVSEIAFASGFNNLANFNRLFRARHGQSPREYRRRIGAV